MAVLSAGIPFSGVDVYAYHQRAKHEHIGADKAVDA